MKKLKNPWQDLEGYYCFGCSPANPFGLKMSFYEDGDEIVSKWIPKPEYQGWLDTLHGGIQAVMLDEICAWVVIRRLQTTGFTSKMETRYKKPIYTTDGHLLLRASLQETRRNIATVKAMIYNSKGEVCTEALCTYFTLSKEKAAEMNFSSCETEGDEVKEL